MLSEKKNNIRLIVIESGFLASRFLQLILSLLLYLIADRVLSSLAHDLLYFKLFVFYFAKKHNRKGQDGETWKNWNLQITQMKWEWGQRIKENGRLAQRLDRRK